MVPLEKCLAVAEECDAPMVSICGGDPLIYPKIEERVGGILKQGRIVLHLHPTSVHAEEDGRLPRRRLFASPRTQAEGIAGREALFPSSRLKQSAKAILTTAPVIAPSKWMYWNVHGTVSNIRMTSSSSGKAVQGMRRSDQDGEAARFPGGHEHHGVSETESRENEAMFQFFSSRADGHTISPGLRLRCGEKRTWPSAWAENPEISS